VRLVNTGGSCTLTAGAGGAGISMPAVAALNRL
jgi:hypothetical protein